MMDKKTFKMAFYGLLEASVDGLTNEQKIKYMKKWIRDHEKMDERTTGKSIQLPNSIHVDSTEKIGELVRTKLAQIIRNHLLSTEKIRFYKMQDTARIYSILIIRCLKRLHMTVL
jgi:hypothetical protein